MIQNFIDFVSVTATKNLIEFEAVQQNIYNQSYIEFPNKKSGRITGEILPDRIDPKGKWVKHYLTTIERNKIQLLAVETEYKLNDLVNYEIQISFSPSVSINAGKNNKPVSLKSFNRLVDRIERDYCIEASDLVLHCIERTFLVESNAELAKAFIEGADRFLLFKNEILHPFFNDQTHGFMGVRGSLTHSGFKFYLVDSKYQEELFLFRMERKYKRMFTFKRSIGVNTLKDLRSLEVAHKCAKKTLEDWDDVIISDPNIIPPNNLSKKQLRIFINSHDRSFWLTAKKEKDKNTYRDWVSTFRKLSDEYGDGFHTKIRKKIIEQIEEIEFEIENQNRKSSPHVTCNYGVTYSEIDTKDSNKVIKQMNNKKELINRSKKQIQKEKIEQGNMQFRLFNEALGVTLHKLEKKK